MTRPLVMLYNKPMSEIAGKLVKHIIHLTVSASRIPQEGEAPTKEKKGKVSSPQEIVTGEQFSVSDTTTLDYQIDRLIDDLQHLETEHLPAQGRIAGKTCDCIAKAARDLRRHSLETIPIASRQGKDAKLFSELASRADHLIEIGNLEAVNSGNYDEEYLRQAGQISTYRKQVEKMRCGTCGEALKTLKEYMGKRKA